MSTPLDLFVQSITGAFTRIRALLFVSLGLCAIILSNAYLEHFSFDDELIMQAYVFREAFEQKQTGLEATLKSENNADKQQRLRSDISELKSRINRVDNTLKDFKLRHVTVPLTGVNVPANDLNVVCGIFLLFLSLWLIFSVNQVRSAFHDETMRAGLEEYVPALRNSVMFVLPKERKLLRGLTVLLIAAPAITMTIATGNDLTSVLTYDFKKQVFAIFDTILIRLIFLTAVSVILWMSSVVCLRVMNDLTTILHPDTVRTQD